VDEATRMKTRSLLCGACKKASHGITICMNHTY